MAFDRNKIPRLHHLASGIDWTSNEGRQRALLSGAIDYFRGSCKLHNSCSFAHYMLAFHAIELGLKAYLASQGVTDEEFKNKYGHNLSSSYERACKLKLVLKTPNAKEMIEWFDESHRKSADKTKFSPIRYYFIGLDPLPSIEFVQEIAREIIEVQQGWS